MQISDKNEKSIHEQYIKRCYELAVSAGKKGFDTFGAVLVSDGEIIAEAENTADYEKGIFGHAEFNLVHKCANKFSDKIFENAVFYTSCAPCVRCLMAIASLGVKTVVFGVSYKSFQKLLPFEEEVPDYEEILSRMNVSMKLIGPIMEDEGMHTFEYWGGEYRPLEELIREMDEIKKMEKLKMQIINYFESDIKSELTEKIEACDWGAAKFLTELLREDRFFEMLGGEGDLYLLMDGDSLVSFLTLTKQDVIRDESMYPWIGFVFTVPEYRGHRYSEQLMNYAEDVAKSKGFDNVYVATDHVGLYEKFGYEYLENRIGYWGDDNRVLFKTLKNVK